VRELARDREGAPVQLFVLTLIAAALALGIGVDLVTIKGDVGRMNTVFKFYLQAWVFYALAAAYALWRLIPRVLESWPSLLRSTWLTGLVILVVGASIYPIAATPVRVADRFLPLPPTSDGSAFMRTAVYQDEKGPIALRWDWEAIAWLQDNVVGTPVIAEGVTPFYRWGSRVSVHTGLPTIIGWEWHQKQQRWGYQHMVDERISDVNALFSSPDPGTALPILRKYEVSLIYVGRLEHLYYPAAGLAKFDTIVGKELDLVYQNEEVKIYKVR